MRSALVILTNFRSVPRVCVFQVSSCKGYIQVLREFDDTNLHFQQTVNNLEGCSTFLDGLFFMYAGSVDHIESKNVEHSSDLGFLSFFHHNQAGHGAAAVQGARPTSGLLAVHKYCEGGIFQMICHSRFLACRVKFVNAFDCL